MNRYAKVTVFLLAAAVVAAACTSTPKFTDVKDKDWELVEVRTQPENIQFDRNTLIEEGFENIFTLRFDAERVSGVGAPNNFFAPYTLDGKQGISIKTIAQTLMAPLREPEKLKELDFFTYLGKTSKWNLVKGKLELYTKKEDDSDVVLVFVPAGKK